MRPINSNVLVRMKQRDTETKGGIYIPERARTVEQWGVVIAAGEKCEEVAAGDLVFVSSTQGTHYSNKEGDFIIVREDAIKCKLVED